MKILVYVELYTESHGKVLGIVYGATSKKIKSYLQIGNKLHLNYNLKNENRIGYLKIEIDVTGGANYSFMGTNQMMSVPYALYAESAGNLNSNSNSGNSCNSILCSYLGIAITLMIPIINITIINSIRVNPFVICIISY